MIEINKIYKTEITGYGSDGEGIGRIDKFAVFVPMSAVGDILKVRITKLYKSYARGEIYEIISPSAERSVPSCDSFAECGGCNLLHLNYDAQLKFKQRKVADALRKIGGFHDLSIFETVPSPKIYRYRNKVNIPVYRENGKLYAGFYKSKTHRAVKSSGCLLQESVNAKITDAVISYITESDAEIKHIYIRSIAGKIMVSLESETRFLPNEEKLISTLLKVSGRISSIIINSNKPRAVYGNLYLTDTLLGLKFKIHHDSFYQVNKGVCELLYVHAVSLLGDLKGKTVFDIYCGIGTISLCIAKKAKRVIGIEYLHRAVKDAQENAQLNNFSNAEFYAGDASKVLHDLYGGGEKADCVVLDPPRKGCDRTLLETLGLMLPEKIVYISCDCATLARDMKIMTKYGYMPKSVTPFDMFPMTAHVETVVLLSQRRPDDYVKVKIDLDDYELTKIESKATYGEIKEYVLQNHGLKVSSLYIAQVKKKYGIELGESYNLPKSDGAKQPQCPKEKEDAIVDALKHFKMI